MSREDLRPVCGKRQCGDDAHLDYPSARTGWDNSAARAPTIEASLAPYPELSWPVT